MERNKKLIMVALCVLVAITVLGTIVFKQGIYSKADDISEEQQDELNEKTINLSDYTTDVSFSDEKDIEIIAEEYGIDTSEEIEEIYYCPVEEVEEDLSQITREIGKNEYYVKKKGSTEKKGRLLRSSWFEAPGGTLSVSESVETSVNFSNTASVEGGMKGLKASLTASYGFNVSKSITCTDTQNVNVKKGCKRNCKAYVNVKTYNYELWEDDQWYNDYVGKGSIKKPVGVIFTVGKNIEK